MKLLVYIMFYGYSPVERILYLPPYLMTREIQTEVRDYVYKLYPKDAIRYFTWEVLK